MDIDDDTTPAVAIGSTIGGPPPLPTATATTKYDANLDSIFGPLVVTVQDNIDLYEQPFTLTAVAGNPIPTEIQIYNFLKALTPVVSVLPLLTAVYTKQSADKDEVKAKLTDPVISELANYLATELKSSVRTLTETEASIASKIKAVIDSKKDVLVQAIWAELPEVITRIQTKYNDAVAADAATVGGTAAPAATSVLLKLDELKVALQSMLKSDVNIEAITDGGLSRKFSRSDGRKPRRSNGRRKPKRRSDGKRGKGKRKSPKKLM